MSCVAGLFAEDGEVRLLGSRCASCGTPYFPVVSACHNPDCSDSRVENCDFGGTGVIWSYSIANFAPPPPHKFDQPFRPYVIAVVDMKNGLRLVGQLAGSAGEARIGAEVRLVIDPLYHEDGKTRTTWKFERTAQHQETENA